MLTIHDADTTMTGDDQTRTQPIRTPRATPIRRTAERSDGPLIGMISAIRDYATSRLDPGIAHLCDVAIAGNADALVEVQRAIRTINPGIVFPATNAIPEPVGTWGEERRVVTWGQR